MSTNPEDFPAILQQLLAELQEIRQENTELREQMMNLSANPPQPPLGPIREPKINSPEPFSGDRAKTRGFLVQVSLVFETQPSRFPNDRAKTMYVASYLRGIAAAWFSPRMERNDPMLNNFESFIRNFRKTFEHPDLSAEAARKIRNLKQGNRAVSILANDFRQLAVDVDWTQASLMDAFYDTLLDRVKDRIIEFERPQTLEAYITMAIKIDDRQFQRLQEIRRPNNFVPKAISNTQKFSQKINFPTQINSMPVPMQIDKDDLQNKKNKTVAQKDSAYTVEKAVTFANHARQKISVQKIQHLQKMPRRRQNSDPFVF
jgi:hypothetical protein